jgi:hypothetical protein
MAEQSNPPQILFFVSEWAANELLSSLFLNEALCSTSPLIIYTFIVHSCHFYSLFYTSVWNAVKYFLVINPGYTQIPIPDIINCLCDLYFQDDIFFCSAGSKFCSSNSVEILLVIIPVRVLHMVVKHVMGR